MSAPVQAQSISSLNHLLANPPRYPRNPTHQAHDPLVLYILRVPGGKDIFLTPLKPPTKASISIQSVQSSLYFLHVERPEDEDLRLSLEASRSADTSKQISPITIARKPLPSTPNENYPPSRRPPTPPKSYPSYQPAPAGAQNATQAERYTHRGVNLRLCPPDQTQSNVVPRKPVGARPMPSPDRLEPSTNEPSPASPTDSHEQRQQFGLNRRPVLSTLPVHTHDSRDASPDHLFSTPKPTRYDTPRTDLMRITLIRRDPASGSQWNVGTISLPNVSSHPGALLPFGIELSSPGYVKFSVNEGAAGPTFGRKTGPMIVPSSTPVASGRKRSNSAELFSSAATAASRKPRQAYSFLSPWQGTCSFSNGIDGRSLRCRHVLPTADPYVPGVAADIAEVRFNLPWAKLRPKDTNPRQHSPLDSRVPSAFPRGPPTVAGHKDQWRRSIQNFTTRARGQLSKIEATGNAAAGSPRCDVKSDESSRENDEEPGMRLDLGREKAGGGFKGHSAKLGKLIIEDEGLKMCDLVVAACMGVWWQHYSGNVSF